MTVMHAIFVRLKFEQGLSVGRGTELNVLTIDVDGQGRPILRGTAMAGALRSRMTKDLAAIETKDAPKTSPFKTSNDPDGVKYWFGYALGDGVDDAGYQSRIRLEDSTLATVGDQKISRVHHQRNRHTGVVTAGGLYTMEACPPGTTADTVIWIQDDPRRPHPEQPISKLGGQLVGDGNACVAWIIRTLSTGILLGGRSARGVGLGKAEPESLIYRRFDLTSPADYADFLEVDRGWRMHRQRPDHGDPLPEVGDEIKEQTLRVSLALKIPRGQDLLVAEGTVASPMRVTSGDRCGHWVIPGGTMRGLMRDWFNRLVAREGLEIDDSAAAFTQLDFESQKRHPNVKDAKNPSCPINDLFGTTSQAGRIKITDALASYQQEPEKQLQKRMHVAVDRITGGAADKLLFENEVLVSGGSDSPIFHLEIQIERAQEREARWLGQTIQSLHLGLLRVGSSKSSGRLQLSEKPLATGPFADVFIQNLPQTE